MALITTAAISWFQRQDHHAYVNQNEGGMFTMTHTIFQRDITSCCRAAFGRGLPTPTLPAAFSLVPLLTILFCLMNPLPLYAQARFTGLGFFGGYESRA